MQKILAFIALATAMAGCSSCASYGPVEKSWGSTYTSEERENQKEMKQSLLVKNDVAFVNPLGDKGKELAVSTRTGTGFAVDRDYRKKESLVMTAQHVCAMPASVTISAGELEIEAPAIVNMLSVQDIEGKWHQAVQILSDEKNDVCVLRVIDYYPRDIARLSPGDFIPPLGARLSTAGAPGGEFDWHSSIVQEGFMSGFERFDDHLDVVYLRTSIAATGGESGSAVYYSGRVCGMLTRVYTRFHHISYLVMADKLNAGLAEARKRWHQHPTSKLP